TYHRIGDASTTMFDPGVYSATADELHDQIAHLKKAVSVLSIEEAFAFFRGEVKSRRPQCRTLITFDDGCLDNYEVAFPVLRSLGVQAMFFLISSMVGSNTIPWWDRIAYILRTSNKKSFTLHHPDSLAIDIGSEGFDTALRRVLQLYKRPENSDGDRFIDELRESCGGQEPPASSRIFLNWNEAQEMIAGGMAIGSHTHTHPLLSQISKERQLEEMLRPREILSTRLKTPIDAIAYPVGSQTAFTQETQELAKQAGYTAAFSDYGGTNLPGRISPFDIKRQNVSSQSMSRFSADVQSARLTGCYWP
ncbi:MAG: polysaccharide deacetylase family protein, partial [Terracidiphilus sp.]